MRIPSSEIPQADKLEDIVKVAEAVGKGNETYQDIAAYIGKVERQGRYYRRAAEVLGVIESHHNHAKLTKTGNKLLSTSDVKERNKLLTQLIFNVQIFQRMIPLFESNPRGITKDRIEKFMEEVTQPVGPSMMDRRASTIISWLTEVGVIKEVNSRYILDADLPEKLPYVEFKITEPILPKIDDLREYQVVDKRARTTKSIQVIINDVAKERAENAHRELINLVSDRLSAAGYIGRYNKYIDLAAKIEGLSYLFEMKSITDKNAHVQMRKSLSQLYEYRFLQNVSDAKLVVVLETHLPKDLWWMVDYFEQDRGVYVIWDGNNELSSTSNTKRELSFLGIDKSL